MSGHTRGGTFSLDLANVRSCMCKVPFLAMLIAYLPRWNCARYAKGSLAVVEKVILAINSKCIVVIIFQRDRDGAP